MSVYVVNSDLHYDNVFRLMNISSLADRLLFVTIPTNTAPNTTWIAPQVRLNVVLSLMIGS